MIQKGQKYRNKLRSGHTFHHAIAQLIHRAASLPAGCSQLRQHRADEPFIVACGCGAALLYQVIRRIAENRIHPHRPVHNGLAADVLVDAPGSGNRAKAILAGRVHGKQAGVDIEHAARNGRSRKKPGGFGSLPVHCPADLRRPAERGQLLKKIRNAIAGEQLHVVLLCAQIHQIVAGIVRQLCSGLARQTESCKVLAGEDPFCAVQGLRLVVSEPVQQRDRLAGHDLLQAHAIRLLLCSVRFPAQHVRICTIVGGKDGIANRAPILSPKVQALSMPAAGNSNDIGGVDLRLAERFPNRRIDCIAHDIHIALGKPRLWDQLLRFNCLNRNFVARI